MKGMLVWVVIGVVFGLAVVWVITTHLLERRRWTRPPNLQVYRGTIQEPGENLTRQEKEDLVSKVNHREGHHG